ncbi:hypothetical protein [Methylobacterium sp. WL19]|uniref:hypothetical protein n=1 Tax=Methylobacterium sp. WL19 TaxID=2603896 RepID=UPI0011C92ECE|nr:hypothetical protein [Methylobacterium sp. WL19]TXN33538.1 hypothetical protein FV220_02025 [Methylobacterium sp. WL19]
MTVDRAKLRRVRIQAIGRRTGPEVRTSDVVLAVVGIALLAGLCLLGLANMVGEAQGVAGSFPVSTRTL